jgi:hypothetical integral membrane protein (TIGR02206 family)
MANFFVYKDQLPVDVAVGTLTTTHVMVLIGLFAIMIYFIRHYQSKSQQKRHRFFLVIAFLIPLLEVIRVIWVLTLNRPDLLPVALLPLHLCGIMTVFIPWAVITRKPILIEIVYIVGIAGAGMALLTPDVAMYPLFHLQYIQSMVIHALIFFSGLFFIIVEGYRPSIKRAPNVLGVLIILALLVTPINLLLQHQDANFFFLMYGIDGTILHTIDQNTSHFGYLMVFGVLVIVFLIIMYAPWEIVKRIKHKTLANRTMRRV